MNTFIAYFRIWFSQKFNIPVGIAIISIGFGLFFFFNLIQSIDINEPIKNFQRLDLIIPLGVFLSSVGLLFRKGWARNYTIFFNVYFLMIGILGILVGFVQGEYGANIGLLVFSIALLAAFHGSIIYYLFSDGVKQIYPSSPIATFTIGFFLMFFDHFWVDSNNYSVMLFGGIMQIVGLFIMGKSGLNAKRQYMS